MARFRGENNEKAFETVPTDLIRKIEKTGEVQFALDRITLPDSGLSAGDILLMQEIPAHTKMLRVKVLPADDLGAGSISVGHSASSELGDRDNVVAADPDAFIPASDPDGVTALEMSEDADGYLVEREMPTFLTVTLATVPASAAGKEITVITEYVSK